MIFMSIKNFSILKFNSNLNKIQRWPHNRDFICNMSVTRKKKKRTQPWKRRSTNRWASIIPTLFWNEINPMWMWTDLQLQWFTYNLNQTQLDKRIPPLALPSYIFPGLVTIRTPEIDISPTSKVLLLLFLVIAHVCRMWTMYHSACENFWVKHQGWFALILRTCSLPHLHRDLFSSNLAFLITRQKPYL
jgi:hypothetical protein